MRQIREYIVYKAAHLVLQSRLLKIEIWRYALTRHMFTYMHADQLQHRRGIVNLLVRDVVSRH